MMLGKTVLASVFSGLALVRGCDGTNEDECALARQDYVGSLSAYVSRADAGTLTVDGATRFLGVLTEEAARIGKYCGMTPGEIIEEQKRRQMLPAFRQSM